MYVYIYIYMPFLLEIKVNKKKLNEWVYSHRREAKMLLSLENKIFK